MAQQTLDPRKVLPGYAGELYSLDGEFLAEVNTFEASFNVTNQMYQPAGTSLQVPVMTSYQVTLTFTETVVRDAKLLGILAAALAANTQPVFGFVGVLRNPHGGTEGRYVFRQVSPEGRISIAGVRPGDIVQREWSFAALAPVEVQSLLAS